MHESFSSALNEMSVADAVMQLASGTVELALEDAPEFARWCWFADVLDSDWGLTGRLPAAGNDVLHELERVAGMCRTSEKKTLSPDAWRAAYEATERLASSAGTSSEATYLALSAANDIALECIDETHPEYTVAIALAFESLAAGAADSAVARAWITRALTEWTNRTHPIADAPRTGEAPPITDTRPNASIISAGCGERALLRVSGNL
ncbi:hypothetical protein ACFTWF_36395 [Rhodococcus sp. NPDC056960]|uniref:hypothetical protein n=1 Tax=Rhodococcus TaxID=1827 RepID=UPI003628A0FD